MLNMKNMTNNTRVMIDPAIVYMSCPTESLRWLSPKENGAAPKLQQAYRILTNDRSQKFEWRDVPIIEEE